MKPFFFRGYIAFLTVLALLIFSLSLLITVPATSLGGAREALLFTQSEMLLSALEGCAEEALIQSVRNENYEGGTMTFFGVTCQVAVEKVDTEWTLSLTGSKDDLVRTLRIVVDRTVETPGILTLQSWLEE